MMLLLNTVKLVLIALNIIPNRIRHKKVMFFIYMGTLVTHGKAIFTHPPNSPSYRCTQNEYRRDGDGGGTGVIYEK
jgi:hypothetical protein